MSEIIYGDKAPAGWIFVAGVDESEAYEVDITEIWHDGAKWHLLTATGCSCWDGDYDDEEYDSLEALAAAIGVESDIDRRYNPSLEGARKIVDEARQWAAA